MRIFLDIGAHVGETLTVAVDPKWGFDRIYAFEPAPQCWTALEQLADERVEVLRFGLWSQDAEVDLYDAGSIGASVFAEKGNSSVSTTARMVDAAQWFGANLSSGDEVIAKMNCEGAECEVLDHLVATGEILKLDALLVHFDVRKVPGLEYKERETRKRLERLGVPYRAADDICFGRNVGEKTTNWLNWQSAGWLGRWYYAYVRRVEFWFRTRVYEFRTRRGRAALSAGA